MFDLLSIASLQKNNLPRLDDEFFSVNLKSKSKELRIFHPGGMEKRQGNILKTDDGLGNF